AWPTLIAFESANTRFSPAIRVFSIGIQAARERCQGLCHVASHRPCIETSRGGDDMAIEATKRTSPGSAGSQSTIPAAPRPKNWSPRPLSLWPLTSLRPLAFSLRPRLDLEPEFHV